MTTAWWEDCANQGLIGLGPPPWDLRAWDGWPTEGYDGSLSEHWHEGTIFRRSGHTKAEWLQLANEMIGRWTAWRAEVERYPDEPASPTDLRDTAS